MKFIYLQVVVVVGGSIWMSSDAPDISELLKSHHSNGGTVRKSGSAVSDKGVITAPPTAPVSFTAAILESAGINEETVLQFKNMMAAEHA